MRHLIAHGLLSPIPLSYASQGFSTPIRYPPFSRRVPLLRGFQATNQVPADAWWELYLPYQLIAHRSYSGEMAIKQNSCALPSV